MTVVLTVTATRSADGKGRVQGADRRCRVRRGASRERGSEQTVTVVFAGPVDRDGHPVKVAQSSDSLIG